ncbi:hypothetical protein [Cellulomonas sp. HZM]|uniref:hypothetical protein n=1 Tax=Cellulomonas sp. HZM TaxID=1454010 RepID=UPI000691F0C0|nr:hypothetical protein [Cellulomonas sp. HZM]
MSSTISGYAGRTAAVIVASALTASALTISPWAVDAAHADTVTASDGASATVADVVSSGNAIHLEGSGWTTTPTSHNGSTIGVKLGDALTTEPKSGPVTNPATGTSADAFDIWAAIEAEDDGTFSADIPFPTPDNTAPALETAWAVGSTHTLRLLTGSLENGDTPRSVLLTFTIGAGLVSSATTAADGQVTVSFSGGAFPAGEVLSVAQGGTARQWTVTSGRTSTTSPTYTVPASGALTAKVVLPAGAATAGTLRLDITGDKGTTKAASVVVPPAAVLDPGATLGTSGTLTLSGLAAGATLSSVKLGSAVLGTDRTADDQGKVSLPYAIAADAPSPLDLVVVQATPEALTFTLPQTVYPNEAASGTGRFDVTSTTADQGLYQGFYQSAYSAAQDALYVTASDRGTGTKGYIYKLDPVTLQVEASHETVDHDGFTKTGAFGIAVDDEHGNVWVSNTGSASVAVYSESDLSLVKQFPANTITHPRDVVVDPSTGLVFVSSASEGSSATANGYISVFEADDKDGDGTKYEKVTDIQTGTRDFFNPVSLSLDGGTLVSPSLQGNRVAKIRTADATTEGYQPTFLTVDGLNGVNGVRGSGGSGIAYDAKSNRVFVASQSGNEVVIADATTGETLREVPTGRGALNTVIDHVHGLVYVSNLTGTSVTVLDLAGNKVASLPIASVNHVSVDVKGNAFAVDKASSNKVWRIVPRIEAIGGVDVLDPTASSATGAPATTPLKISVTYGEKFHVEGANFRDKTGANGSTLAVKLDGGAAEPKAGKATNPSNGDAPVSGVYAVAAADQDGTWSLDLPFPTAAAVSDASLAWGVGSTHYLRLLSGSLRSGDTPRSIAVAVTVTPAGSTAGTVKVEGTAKVGQTVRAGTSGWAAGTTLAYTWLRGGATIAGAKGATYALTPSDVGTKVSVRVTGTLVGHTDASTTSAAVTVAAGTLTAGTPKVSGTAKVGKKLTASAGTWTKGTTLAYQWNRSGKAISGARSSSYTLTSADKGKKITVTVTGSQRGYTTASKTSAATAAVAAGTLTKATPKVSGTAKVGKTLKVKAGTWTSGTRLTYRWYANGKAISGATGTSLKLKSSLAGKKITVKVTGKKSGYTTATATSKSTGKVKR